MYLGWWYLTHILGKAPWISVKSRAWRSRIQKEGKENRVGKYSYRDFSSFWSWCQYHDQGRRRVLIYLFERVPIPMDIFLLFCQSHIHWYHQLSNLKCLPRTRKILGREKQDLPFKLKSMKISTVNLSLGVKKSIFPFDCLD